MLAKRQAEMWGAIQEWLKQTHEVDLHAFEGIMPQSQPETVTPHLQKAVRGVDDWDYVALYRAATLSGSLALGLRFVTGTFSVSDLMAHAFLDDYHQEQKWGIDEWAVERRDNIEQELQDASRFMTLLRS